MSTYPQSFDARIHALDLAITNLEHHFVRLYTAWTSLPPTALTDPRVSPVDLDICRHEFDGRSGFFRIQRVPSRNVVEANRLRTQASKIQTLLTLWRNHEAVETINAAEQNVPVYHTHLASLQNAVDNISIIANQHNQAARLRNIRDTLWGLENRYAALKARFHAVSEDIAQVKTNCWDLVVLDEAFDESPVKRSEFEIRTGRLRAIIAKAETAVDQFSGYEFEDLMQEAQVVIGELEVILTELGKLVSEQERKIVRTEATDRAVSSSTHGGVPLTDTLRDLEDAEVLIPSTEKPISPPSLTSNPPPAAAEVAGTTPPLSARSTSSPSPPARPRRGRQAMWKSSTPSPTSSASWKTAKSSQSE